VYARRMRDLIDNWLIPGPRPNPRPRPARQKNRSSSGSSSALPVAAAAMPQGSSRSRKRPAVDAGFCEDDVWQALELSLVAADEARGQKRRLTLASARQRPEDSADPDDESAPLREAMRRRDGPTIMQLTAERNQRLTPMEEEADADTCMICKEALVEECTSSRDPKAWGYTPCCRAYMHKRCLNEWVVGVGQSGSRAVWAPTVDGRDNITKEMDPKCPHCRSPVTGRELHLGRRD